MSAQLARINVFTNNILSIVTWLPAVGAILILGLFRKEQTDLIKKFATGWLVLDFIASLWLLGYDRGLGGRRAACFENLGGELPHRFCLDDNHSAPPEAYAI